MIFDDKGFSFIKLAFFASETQQIPNRSSKLRLTQYLLI